MSTRRPRSSRRRDGFGGRLVFLHPTPLAHICVPDVGRITTELQRPYFGLGRVEWPGEDEGVEYQLTYGAWIDLLYATGFEVERLIELEAPAGAKTHLDYSHVPADWARKWPNDEIWVARKK